MARNYAQFDPRSWAIKGVQRAMEDIYTKSTRPIDYAEARVLISYCTDNVNFRRLWFRRLDKYNGAGRMNDWVFQNGLRSAIWQEWVRISSNVSTPDTLFHSLHAHFYPMAGVESYLLRNPFCFVKDGTIAGGTTIVSGPKGSGKTEYAALDNSTIAMLKQGQLDQGVESQFGMIHRGAARFLRPLDDPLDFVGRGNGGDGLAAPDDGGVPDGDGEPVKADEIVTTSPAVPALNPRKLDLYNAVDVRFPTNMTVRNKGPLMGRIQFGGRISDILLDAIRNDMKTFFSRITIDEFGIAANKRRGNTTANWIILQFVQTHRKLRSSLLIVAQSEEHQVPAEITEAAQTKVEKLGIQNLDEALITVSGLFQQQRFRDIPPSPSSPDTQSQASFAPDITPTVVWENVAAKQREAILAGEEWTHMDELRAAEDFILKNRASLQEIAEGKSGILRSEIRSWLDKTDPATKQPYTLERIARVFAEETDQDWRTEMLPIVREVAERKKAEDKARKDGKPPVKSSEQVQEEAEA
jgi:hypothetical protein